MIDFNMSESSATVRRLDCPGAATVSVEVLPGNAFDARFELRVPAQVETLTSEPISPIEVEVTCLSAVRFARGCFCLERSVFIIRSAFGSVMPSDIPAFAAATVVAIARAANKPKEIPSTLFQSLAGEWEVLGMSETII
jgi:hypothetical protein